MRRIWYTIKNIVYTVLFLGLVAFSATSKICGIIFLSLCSAALVWLLVTTVVGMVRQRWRQYGRRQK